MTTSKEIRFPFTFDRNGRVGVTTDPDEQLRQHVLALLNTIPGERVIRVTYGVSLIDFLFENLVPAEISEMQQRISDGFDRWIPTARLVELTGVAGPNGDVSQGTANITVKYARRYDSTSAGVTTVDIPILTI